MAKGYTISDQKGLHFLTFTVVGWVDVFTRDIYRQIVMDSFRYCIAEKGLILHAYVIMSNHIHIIGSTENDEGLSAIIRDFKKFTSAKIIKEIENNKQESRREWMLRLFKYYAKFNSNNPKNQFWKQDNRPIELVSLKWIRQKLDYIHLNPVRAKWVEFEDDYLYSSARNYSEGKGLINVELLDLYDV